jgi:hypothetical protein
VRKTSLSRAPCRGKPFALWSRTCWYVFSTALNGVATTDGVCERSGRTRMGRRVLFMTGRDVWCGFFWF